MKSVTYIAHALLAISVCACEPTLDVGAWKCSDSEADSATSDMSSPVTLPWSTGFEHEFCDYADLGGFCIVGPLASHTIVTTPVHTGRYAAAFSVTSADLDGQQSRCVRRGTLPSAAYYGAWYFVPATATNRGNWNLFHFRTGDTSAQHGLWDVSLVNGNDGELQLVVFDFLNSKVRSSADPKPIPIGAWFHVEFYLKRASGKTGEVALYQDGQLLLEAANLITDDSASGQWYVGNLATELTPAGSTLYVDDVTIRDAR